MLCLFHAYHSGATAGTLPNPFPSSADRTADFLAHGEVARYSNSRSALLIISVEEMNEIAETKA